MEELCYATRWLSLIPGLGRFPGEGKGYPLQYSGLENSMNCIVHGITKSRTRQSDFHFLLIGPVKFYEAVRCLFDLGHIIYLWVKLYLNDSIPNHADEITVVVKASLLFVCFYMQYPSLDLQAFEPRVQKSSASNSFSLPSHFIVSKPLKINLENS